MVQAGKYDIRKSLNRRLDQQIAMVPFQVPDFQVPGKELLSHPGRKSTSGGCSVAMTKSAFPVYSSAW